MVCVSLFRKFCVGETKFSIPQSADADERDDVGIVPYNTKGVVALKRTLELIDFR